MLKAEDNKVRTRDDHLKIAGSSWYQEKIVIFFKNKLPILF